MDDAAEFSIANTSPFYPFYQLIFEAADQTSNFWQPLLKAVGRSQLEFAGLQARQAEAFVHWTHRVLQPISPADLANANARLWTTIAEQYADVLPRMVAAVGTASESVAPIVLPVTPKRSRDTLILLDLREEGAEERKVA